MSEARCPLCGAGGVAPFARDKRREYLRCHRCRLVFVPPAYRLDAAAERVEYELHENDPDDPGYRRFLSRLFDPLVKRLPSGADGLDFGCGPGPALAAMLREAGYRVALYDPIFYPEAAAMAGHYRFITATEVVEHLFAPDRELARLWHCLQPGGVLGVMTKLVRDVEAFASWHYKNDPTHVIFFSRETWVWWAQKNDATLEFVGDDVMLLTKS